MALVLVHPGAAIVPANDCERPISTVELALKLRPTGTRDVWRLDPKYRQWIDETFPEARFYFCPLEVFDRSVRPAGAELSLEQAHHMLASLAERVGGYRIEGLGWGRSAPFAVGCRGPRALIEFLFRWT
jgi:hypothetical protein